MLMLDEPASGFRSLMGPVFRERVAQARGRGIESGSLSEGGTADFGLLDEPTPHPSHWYSRWRGLAEADRNVLRTYTPAAIRTEKNEIDVDFVLREPAGPASRWAMSTYPGEELVITGPDIRAGYTGYGINWVPGDARRVLLIGDETAFPAIRNILSTLDGLHIRPAPGNRSTANNWCGPQDYGQTETRTRGLRAIISMPG